MSGSVAPIELRIVVSDELVARLEPVLSQVEACPEEARDAPSRRGSPYRYRFRRALLSTLADVVLVVPARIEDLLWTQVTVPVDLNEDTPWLPLLTHRMLPRPAVARDEQGRFLHTSAEADDLVEKVAQAIRGLGGRLQEARDVTRARYTAGDGFDTLFRKAVQK